MARRNHLRVSQLPNRGQWITTMFVAATLGIAGCAAPPEESSSGDPAAKVEAIEGSDVSRVTLSELGAKRLGIVTKPVAAAPGGKGMVVPYAAVVYDADGVAWTFTNPSGHSYLRAKVEISAINGPDALLSSGPVVGTPVVTVGVAELVGAEAELGA